MKLRLTGAFVHSTFSYHLYFMPEYFLDSELCKARDVIHIYTLMF
jgi:hypothetical protein